MAQFEQDGYPIAALALSYNEDKGWDSGKEGRSWPQIYVRNMNNFYFCNALSTAGS